MPEPREERVHRGPARRNDEPDTPTDVDTKLLPIQVRAELRSLPKELAATVMAHLVAAGELIDVDPKLAYAHAEAARRRAARLPVVREAAAETAYAAGEYAAALTEYRALHRMTGGGDYLPVMADCERALGRPEASLKLAREASKASLSPAQTIEMLIVQAGARADLGQRDEAARLLRAAIESRRGPKPGQARLRYAYADLMLADGDGASARQWFAAAAQLDPEGDLDSDARLAELDGVFIEADFDEDDDEDDSVEDDDGSDDDSEPVGADTRDDDDEEEPPSDDSTHDHTDEGDVQ